MHSTLVRAQNVFGLFTTVAFCVATAIALSVLISPQAPSASVKLRNVQVYGDLQDLILIISLIQFVGCEVVHTITVKRKKNMLISNSTLTLVHSLYNFSTLLYLATPALLTSSIIRPLYSL